MIVNRIFEEIEIARIKKMLEEMQIKNRPCANSYCFCSGKCKQPSYSSKIWEEII